MTLRPAGVGAESLTARFPRPTRSGSREEERSLSVGTSGFYQHQLDQLALLERLGKTLNRKRLLTLAERHPKTFTAEQAEALVSPEGFQGYYPEVPLQWLSAKYGYLLAIEGNRGLDAGPTWWVVGQSRPTVRWVKRVFRGWPQHPTETDFYQFYDLACSDERAPERELLEHIVPMSLPITQLVHGDPRWVIQNIAPLPNALEVAEVMAGLAPSWDEYCCADHLLDAAVLVTGGSPRLESSQCEPQDLEYEPF